MKIENSTLIDIQNVRMFGKIYAHMIRPFQKRHRIDDFVEYLGYEFYRSDANEKDE